MPLFGKRIKEDDNQPRSPFIETNKNTTSPFIKFTNEINGTTRFAITKDTENGKYNAAGMLYYKLNGVEIYTELNNIIFVDTIANTLVIKEYADGSANVNPSSPEEKQYILV